MRKTSSCVFPQSSINKNESQNQNNSQQNQINKMILSLQKIPSPYSRKVQKILEELLQYDPDSLMLKVDPLINSEDTIKQIQQYYNDIIDEVNQYINQIKLEDSLKKKINKIPKQIELLVHPPKDTSIPPVNQNNNDNKNNNDVEKDGQKENKPVIDYHYKLKNLETEIGHNYQKYNTIKSKNNKLLIQLEEMRKENIFYMNKLSELKKELKEKEKHYNETKAKVEENSNKNNDKELNNIIEKQNDLNKKTQEMTDNILDNNSAYIEKVAKIKYLDFKKDELKEEIKNLEEKKTKEQTDFNEKIKKEYNKIKDYQQDSKIINELDKDKMQKLEELFNQILEETKTQNSIQLIEHLSRTRQENISFKSSVETLYEYVHKLEDEVQTLEYIICFCEESMKNKVKLGENDIKNVDDINKASELYIKLQYNVINVLYKQYKDKLFEILKEFNIKSDEKLFESEDINSFIAFTVDMQEKLKKISEKIKIETTGYQGGKNVFDFNKWNNKWDRINLVKDEVIKDYYSTFGKGLRFNKKSIKSLVDQHLIKDKKNPAANKNAKK